MESPLKQRLIGAAVLAALAIVFLPALLDGPDVKDPDAAEVPLEMPAAPDDRFETRELSLGAPEAVPPGGVLGMDTAPQPAAPLPSPAPTAPEPTAPAPAADPTPVAPAAATPVPTPAPAVATPLPTTPAPTPTPAPVAPAAVAGGNYALNVGTYSNVDNANALVARLRAAKLPVTAETVRLNGGPAVRVRIGPYAERAAAEAARLRTDAIAGGSSRVIALDGRALAASPTPKPALPAALPPKPATATPAPAAPRPVAPTPAPATPAATASGFAVQLAAPAEEAAALGLRDRARAAGFTAFVQRVDTSAGARFRVRIGPTADRAAADALRDSANQKLGIAGNVVAHP